MILIFNCGKIPVGTSLQWLYDTLYLGSDTAMRPDGFSAKRGDRRDKN